MYADCVHATLGLSNTPPVKLIFLRVASRSAWRALSQAGWADALAGPAVWHGPHVPATRATAMDNTTSRMAPTTSASATPAGAQRGGEAGHDPY
eukprot:1822715-Prymnesium_polylepis.2